MVHTFLIYSKSDCFMLLTSLPLICMPKLLEWLPSLCACSVEMWASKSHLSPTADHILHRKMGLIYTIDLYQWPAVYMHIPLSLHSVVQTRCGYMEWDLIASIICIILYLSESLLKTQSSSETFFSSNSVLTSDSNSAFQKASLVSFFVSSVMRYDWWLMIDIHQE